MAAVLLQPRMAAAAPLAVGSVKANAGHSEPGAGFSGLLRLVSAMACEEVAPNAQLRALKESLQVLQDSAERTQTSAIGDHTTVSQLTVEEIAQHPDN